MTTTISTTAGADARETTMRAATVVGPGRVVIQELPVPEPGADQVRIRLEGCGVCASNIPPFEGREWFSYPFAPGALGHEGWGRVDAVGREVRDVTEGDRVAFISEHAYAEYDVVDAAGVVKLPASLEGRPLPGEPLGCAMNVFRRSQVEAGQTVAIVGVGFLGALLTQLASAAGAAVFAISRRAAARAVGEQMGARWTAGLEDHGAVIEQVKQITQGRMCDLVIECVGKQEPLDLASQLAGVRGRLVIAGYHQDGLRQVNMQLWNWHGLDVINAHERDPAMYMRGIRDAVEAMAEGRLSPDPLFTHVYGLGQLDQALEATRDRPGNFMKALIDMNR